MTRLTKSESKSDNDVSQDMKLPATNHYEINDPGMILDHQPVAVASE